VTHTVQQCYAATVHVTGHAFLDDTQTAGDTLRSAMTGSYSGFDTFSFVATLTRQ
jgi:hypothetical protein